MSSDWSFSEARDYATALFVGERVRLRGVRTSDIDNLVAWGRLPESLVLQTNSVLPLSEDAARAMYQRYAANDSASRGFAVETIETDGAPSEFIGFTTLFAVDAKNRSALFAIELSPDSGGHGYGSDAAALMVRYGFREMGLHRIHLQVWAYNERAQKTYLRAGFREEGRARDAVFHDGRWHDEVLMSVLETD
jgi:RimJ/RimL family protein N-acetyltransferase